MTIRVVVTVPENQPGPVQVRPMPVDGSPFSSVSYEEVAPGQTREFSVWAGHAIQISEKPS